VVIDPDFLTRTANLYGSCRTYQDTGEFTKVEVTGRQPLDVKRTNVRFRTVYAQPDRLLFEYTEVGVGPEAEWYRKVIWGSKESARSWDTQAAKVSLPEPAPHVILAAFGGSLLGGLFSVPFLLFYARVLLPELSTATLVESDEVGGRACARIEWGWKRGREVAWIETASGLLLKREHESVFDEESRKERLGLARAMLASMPSRRRSMMEKTLHIPPHEPDHRTEATTVWRPVLDEPVDPARLEFTPPAGRS
jgi:hypothetical protein